MGGHGGFGGFGGTGHPGGGDGGGRRGGGDDDPETRRGAASGHSVNGKAFTPVHDTPAVVRDYVSQNHMGLHHDSETQLHRRAAATQKYMPAEKAMLDDIGQKLDDGHSAEMRQSSWMAHVQRGDLGSLALSDDARAHLAAEFRSGASKAVPKTSEAAREAMAMAVQGQHGPLTLEQSRQGAEMASVSQILQSKFIKAEMGPADLASQLQARKALRSERVEATRELDEHGKPSHQTRSEHGMNLANDVGTRMRDRVGLPVMSGTSGTSSEVVSSHRFAAQRQGVSMHAPGFGDDSGHTPEHNPGQTFEATTNLMFHQMRSGAVPQEVGRQINAQRARLGLPVKDVPDAHVQTHSYPEVRAGVALTLAKVNPADEAHTARKLASSTIAAKSVLDRYLPKKS
ncbi:hypothetical protein [Andreprevotia sp. IGB-42]|uniref:hypothetical protein n=1 Tax=Andreprevotia sp. IGB-42 TaxID=2497473 RepID=UPI00135C844C|nr:hypothetical protein [Andreprevotia sp. IGB-42]